MGNGKRNGGWGGCGLKVNISGESKLICPFTITIVTIIKIIWTSLLVSSSDCYLDLFLILYLSSLKNEKNPRQRRLNLGFFFTTGLTANET